MFQRGGLAALCIVFSLAGAMLLTPSRSNAQNQSGIIAVVWSPDGSKIATANFNGTLRIWNVVTQRLVAEMKDPAGRIDTITWKPDGTRIATLGGDDGVIRIWNVSNGWLIKSLSIGADPNGLGVVAWSPDGTKIASVMCSESAPVKIWSAVNDNYHLLATSGEAAFYNLSWSPDSSKLAVAGIVNLYVVDSLTAENLQFHVVGPFVVSTAWSPDGTKVAGGDAKGAIHIIDVVRGKELDTLMGHSGPVDSLSWNPDGATLLSTSHDNTLRIWDIDTGKTLVTMPVSNDLGIASSLADWSPFGGRLAYYGKGLVTSQVLATEVQINVPFPTPDALQALTKRCTKANIQQKLTTRITAKQFAAFTNDVKAMTSEQIPSTCAADLIAIANALQAAN